MIKTKKGTSTIYDYSSIRDLINFIHKTKRTDTYKYRHCSDDTSKHMCDFTGTGSYEEAERLLLHGWEVGTLELIKSLKSSPSALKRQIQNTYSVQGYQPCVPRYLQGLPDSMINHKITCVKGKILNIYKSVGYAYYTTAKEIQNESVKALRLINTLESKGYRCNLYIIYYCEQSKVTMKIKIKSSGQKLNIKQVAFPLIHPSMFRRICFAAIERIPEKEICRLNYGTIPKDENIIKYMLNKGDVFIPNIVEEKEITDVNKYIV